MTTLATKYVAQQLKELLGTYVEGVSEDSLNLQLLGGKLKLGGNMMLAQKLEGLFKSHRPAKQAAKL